MFMVMRPDPLSLAAPLLLAALCLCLSCVGARRGALEPAAAGAPVAAIDGAPILAADVAAEMRRSGKTARAALDAMADFELLAAAAARSIGPGDPDVAEARRRAMVQVLLARELEPRLDKSAIPERELRGIYERAKSAFVHPRQTRAARSSRLRQLRPPRRRLALARSEALKMPPPPRCRPSTMRSSA